MKHIGLRRGTVKLLPYDKAWPKLFEAERAKLFKALDGIIFEIEHIGSTSVPGLAAKPLIDIMASVSTLRDYEKAIKPLEALGYEYMPDRVFGDRIFFPKGPQENRTVHLSLVEKNSTQWTQALFFREYLRDHPDKRDEYGCLKEDLVKRFEDDRKRYSEGKNEFIQSILLSANRESVLM